MNSTRAWPSMRRPLVAILRGIRPIEVEPAVSVLVEAGFEAIEIPLNSPDPFHSVERAVQCAPDTCLIGAGTVLTPMDVDRLVDSGGRLMVSPNVNADTLRHGVSRGLATMPGVFTATEALLACDLGASALKFFPASALGPAGIKGIMAILPPGTVVGAVGGISEQDFSAYRIAGINVFGLGSSLYVPGLPLPELKTRATAAIAAYDDADG